jgi:hypothetical protein
VRLFPLIYLLVYEWRSSDGTSMNDYMSVGDDEDEDEDEDEDPDVDDVDEDQEGDEESV